MKVKLKDLKQMALKPRKAPSLTKRDMFPVQREMCESCIYRPDSILDIKMLEAQVADEHMKGFFASYRACHHAVEMVNGQDVCCAGFWNRYKHKFALGQMAQRLNAVHFVQIDDL